MLESARLGPIDGQNSARSTVTGRPHQIRRRYFGPEVEDEYLFKVVDVLDVIAKETGRPVSQVALNWLSQRPTVCNIVIGARTEEQLKQNLGAIGWKLTAEQIARLMRSAENTPYPYWHQRILFSEIRCQSVEK